MANPSQNTANPSETAPAAIADHLKILRDSLDVQVPYTGGIHPVKAEDLVIYYDVEGEEYAKRLDFGNSKEKDLLALASACDQATFGMDNKDVLDEKYRKAGKMDLTKFATRLDVVATGLIDAISPDLLQGQDADGEKALRAELYKLNVYGPGSFFKAHKDTPRGTTMIGSLVIIFPTAHTGGALTLEYAGATWTFDSAAELAAVSGPGLAYVAFYSDVTHAVEPVQTGHRVTLTYNLFLVDRGANNTMNRITPDPERAFEDALRRLLAEPSFLPNGGFLAYGLSHQYPMPAPPEIKWVNGRREMPPSRLAFVLHLLKGSDARARTVSEHVGLATHVKMLYDSGENLYYRSGHDVVADDVLNTDDVDESSETMTVQDAIEGMGIIVQRGEERTQELLEEKVKRYGPRRLTGYGDDEDEEQEGTMTNAVEVLWVTRITDLNRVRSAYMAYGNEASIKHVYGNAALFVRVPAFGEGLRA